MPLVPPCPLVGLITLCLSSSACTFDPGEPAEFDEPMTIVFSAERDFLDGAEFDLGFLELDEGAQIGLTAQAGGSVRLAAAADSNRGVWSPVEGSGELSLDANILYAVVLKSDDGSIDRELGLIDLQLPPAVMTFNPFLLRESVNLETELAPRELGSIPMTVGAVEATLRVDLLSGEVDVRAMGVCAELNSQRAHFVASLETLGHVTIRPTLILHRLGEPEIRLAELELGFPKTTKVVDLGDYPANGIESGSGACGAAG